MKLKVFLFSILLWNVSTAIGQECGTPTPTNLTTYPQPSPLRSTSFGQRVCIDIQFHVVRNTDGSFAFTPPNENALLNVINQHFNPHHFYFSSVGINYIDNSDYISLDSMDQEAIISNHNPNAINYYIVQEVISGSLSIAGKARSIPETHLFIRNNYTLTTTSPHEVGHCLGLLHTHATSRGVETIGGFNCATAGDLVCDTPADPNLTGNVGFGCIYNGGGGYDPLTDNLMSYAPNSCRSNFTEGQEFRMRHALANESILQGLNNNSCNIANIEWDYDDRAGTCLNQNKTFTLTNLPPSTNVYWTVTNNLSITSSTSNTVTVQLNSLGSEAVITGRVQISGLFYYYTLELEQLQIPDAANIELESFNSAPIYTGTFTNITARYNSFIDAGQLGYTWDWYVQSSQVRHNSPTYSYIHVSPIGNPNTVYIRTRASNECGSSAWKGKTFIVEASSNNGCTSCPTDDGQIHP